MRAHGTRGWWVAGRGTEVEDGTKAATVASLLSMVGLIYIVGVSNCLDPTKKRLDKQRGRRDGGGCLVRSDGLVIVGSGRKRHRQKLGGSTRCWQSFNHSSIHHSSAHLPSPISSHPPLPAHLFRCASKLEPGSHILSYSKLLVLQFFVNHGMCAAGPSPLPRTNLADRPPPQSSPFDISTYQP